MAQHKWQVPSNLGDMPSHAVLGGHDSDGSQIYIGRCYYQGDVLVAKIVPSRHQAYICFSGEEIEVHDVEVITGEYYKWVQCSGGFVPNTSVRGGVTSNGEPLYIGRGRVDGALTPGKIHPSHGCLYVGYGGSEHKLDSYEVLVQPETWIHSNFDNIPYGAIVAGHDEDGSAIYLGRTYHDGDLLPVKIVPTQGKAYAAFGGQEHEKYDFEVLVGAGYDWVPASNGDVPSNAAVAGQTSDGEPLYFGRGHWSNSLVPGKVHQSHGCLYIPFGGEEIKLTDYEVLVRA